MSDLISRSDVLDLLYGIFDKYKMSTVKNTSIGKSFGTDVFEEIRNMPTAYSVDGVAEELEKELEKGNIAIDLGEFRLFEIVKQGGMSDDVCEWELDGVYLHSPHKPLVSCVTDENYRYYYCPVCGKKIKAVE